MHDIIQTITQISKDQRTKVISLAASYLENITDVKKLAAILQTIALIPEEERNSDVIKKLGGIFSKALRIGILFTSVSRISLKIKERK